jgi:hypothetical protein
MKRKQATRVVLEMRLNFRATIIQSLMKGKLASQLMKKMRYERVMLVRLQRFLRKRHQCKVKSSLTIQKYMKGFVKYIYW